ncbi:UNVERIFIED_CONTAM: hypothetical protein FKN15_029065 [Acipenser sinensis]
MMMERPVSNLFSTKKDLVIKVSSTGMTRQAFMEDFSRKLVCCSLRPAIECVPFGAERHY